MIVGVAAWAGTSSAPTTGGSTPPVYAGARSGPTGSATGRSVDAIDVAIETAELDAQP